MRNNKISISLFVVLLITLLPYQNPEATTNDLITTTCEKTMYKDVCIASLRSESQGANNLQGLGQASLKLALASAKEIHGSISELLKKSEQPFIQQRLKDCSKNFEEAITQIQDSVTAFDSKKYNDVNMKVTAAMSSEESCEDGFKENPSYKSPLTNAKFRQLCSISLTISNLLDGKA